jgi:hypothetical protein
MSVLQSDKKVFILMIVYLLFFSSCRTSRFFSSESGNTGKFKERMISSFPDIINETSGLEYFNGRFWTFNDSGGEALIYSFSPDKENLDIKYYFTGLKNRDWEDICADDTFLYIADIGNNFGSRDTLKIHKIRIEDFLSWNNKFETISFSFNEKTPEFKNSGNNPFDCEALIIRNDTLYAFTKNWKDKSSQIYRIPTTPGHYDLSASASIYPEMLVTGAEYSPSDKKLYLIGYRNYIPVIFQYEFESDIPKKEIEIILGRRTGLQVEAICTDDKGNIYFTNEKSSKIQAFWQLQRLK